MLKSVVKPNNNRKFHLIYVQCFTQEESLCIKILDFIEESHETTQAISVLNDPWQNTIFLFVKYLHFAHAEEKEEDTSFADNF